MDWESPAAQRLPLQLGQGKGGMGIMFRSCHISCWCVLWELPGRATASHENPPSPTSPLE